MLDCMFWIPNVCSNSKNHIHSSLKSLLSKNKFHQLHQHGGEIHCACTVELPMILLSTSAAIHLDRTHSALLFSMQSFWFVLLSNTPDNAQSKQTMRELPGGYRT